MTTEAVYELFVPLVPFVLVERCVAIDAADELLVAFLCGCLPAVFPAVERREQTEDDDKLQTSEVSTLCWFSSESVA